MAEKPGNRDDAVSGYVRLRLREWVASGRELQELARLAGMSKSAPSQVLGGTGVGGKTGPGYARAFGFRGYDELRDAAYSWWQAEGRAGQLAVEQTGSMQEAVDAIVGLGQGTKAQCEVILAAYQHPRFRDRDQAWWVQTLLGELQKDRETLRQDKKERKDVHATQKRVREAHRSRKKKDPPEAAPVRVSQRVRAG